MIQVNKLSGPLSTYTVSAMTAAKLAKRDIHRAARRALRGKTVREPQDIERVVKDIHRRGVYVQSTGTIWGLVDERQGPAKDYVLVRLHCR